MFWSWYITYIRRLSYIFYWGSGYILLLAWRSKTSPILALSILLWNQLNLWPCHCTWTCMSQLERQNEFLLKYITKYVDISIGFIFTLNTSNDRKTKETHWQDLETNQPGLLIQEDICLTELTELTHPHLSKPFSKRFNWLIHKWLWAVANYMLHLTRMMQLTQLIRVKKLTQEQRQRNTLEACHLALATRSKITYCLAPARKWSNSAIAIRTVQCEHVSCKHCQSEQRNVNM